MAGRQGDLLGQGGQPARTAASRIVQMCEKLSKFYPAGLASGTSVKGHTAGRQGDHPEQGGQVPEPAAGYKAPACTQT